MRRRSILLPGAAVLWSAAVMGVVVTAFHDGPPPAHTGGFGEQTCAECHFDGGANDPAGSLSLNGVPDGFVPGTRYRLEIAVTHPEMRSGGFQLAARFADAPREGQQAGAVHAVDARVTVLADQQRDVQYAQHSSAGATLTGTAASSWGVEWEAPAEAGAVVFHVAANAANNDLSALGDVIYNDAARTDAKKP
jgi:hypothetical protein